MVSPEGYASVVNSGFLRDGNGICAFAARFFAGDRDAPDLNGPLYYDCDIVTCATGFLILPLTRLGLLTPGLKVPPGGLNAVRDIAVNNFLDTAASTLFGPIGSVVLHQSRHERERAQALTEHADGPLRSAIAERLSVSLLAVALGYVDLCDASYRLMRRGVWPRPTPYLRLGMRNPDTPDSDRLGWYWFRFRAGSVPRGARGLPLAFMHTRIVNEMSQVMTATHRELLANGGHLSPGAPESEVWRMAAVAAPDEAVVIEHFRDRLAPLLPGYRSVPGVGPWLDSVLAQLDAGR